jgi:hypothetical protein
MKRRLGAYLWRSGEEEGWRRKFEERGHPVGYRVKLTGGREAAGYVVNPRNRDPETLKREKLCCKEKGEKLI